MASAESPGVWIGGSQYASPKTRDERVGHSKMRFASVSSVPASGKGSVTERPEQLDSSDDEGVAPALSAAAEELLRGKTMQKDAGAKRLPGRTLEPLQSTKGSPILHSFTSQRNRPTHASYSSPSFNNGSPRIVRIKRNSPGEVAKLRRTASTSSIGHNSPTPSQSALSLRTPAPRPKIELYASAISSSDQVSSGQPLGGTLLGSSGEDGSGGRLQESATGASNLNERPKVDENGPQNSIRVKRVGKVHGRFLSGPARRGVIRRQSGEEQSPVPMHETGLPQMMSAISHDHHKGPSEYSSDKVDSPRGPNLATVEASAERLSAPITTTRDTKPEASEANHVHMETIEIRQGLRGVSSRGPQTEEHHQQAQFKPQPPPHLPSLHDQENEPPPTFKKNKSTISMLGENKMSGPNLHAPPASSATGSPARKALAPRSNNTPRRPAPPPPKMTMLETATATAGAASATQRRLKRQYISINGKMFTKMECIGRGGSGRVYRVMAENFKHFALKRVSLEDIDQAAIRGFKGEIDLLRKLENVDRVIRIYDFEINDEKKTLSVLMDLGELDLKKILDPKLDEETGNFDITFTRYIWKEMLECVQAIHAYDIVHSDLKPANFVSAQGRLKLIDFGIANAIQDDTVNVHRDQQIGTPNYMAPEALLDTNAAGGRRSALGKLMKIGKPSDVWSLACILFQIVYGKPPFGNIQNQMSKVMAITDPSHAINFPEYGIGKIPVPTGLIRTLRRCLNRDPSMRPTIPELLSANDPFLHPDAPGTIQINSEHLKAIQHNVLRIVETYGLPEASGKPRDTAVREWLDQWNPQLFAKMKESIERVAM